MNRLRWRRHEAVYDRREAVEAADELNAEQMEKVASELLQAGVEILARTRPATAAALARP